MVQLWHVGRISHVSLQPGGAAPVSSTARTATTKTFTTDGFVPCRRRGPWLRRNPGASSSAYRHAGAPAMDAGFDGVEVHGANGYLIDQFLRDSINDRNDAYGGPIDNRARLLLEVMQAICGEIGGGRTGLRLSPVTPVNDAGQDSDAQALFNHAVEQLAPLDLAFLHLIEGQTGGPRDIAPFDYAALQARFARRAGWSTTATPATWRCDAVASGAADLVAFGKAFISNPDLVRRLRDDLPLAALNPKTLYGGGAAGYTDYPGFDATAAAGASETARAG